MPAKGSANLPAPRPKTAGSARRKKPVVGVAAASSALDSAVVGQVVLISALAGCAFALVALASYDPHDVSLSVAGSNQTLNLVGPAGAYLADVLYQTFGYAAWSVVMVAVALAMRLAGRVVGGWFSALVSGAGFVLLTAALDLSLTGLVDGASFAPGGVVGMLLAGAIVARLGRVGAGLLVLTGLVGAGTVLFRINWQPLAERAVGQVQRGAPAAVRGVGALGAGAVRASLRAGGAGLDVIRGSLGGRPPVDEEDEDFFEDDEPAGPEPRSTAGGAPLAPPAAAGPTTLPVRRAPEAVERRAAEPRRAPVPSIEPIPELPSVWSARQAPPAPAVAVTTGDPERDAPTKVAGRTLVEVEWEPTSTGRRAGEASSNVGLPAHLRGGTPAPVTRSVQRPTPLPVVEQRTAPASRPTPAPVEWAEDAAEDIAPGRGGESPARRPHEPVLSGRPVAPAHEDLPPILSLRKEGPPIVNLEDARRAAVRPVEAPPAPRPALAPAPPVVAWADPPTMDEEPPFEDEDEVEHSEPSVDRSPEPVVLLVPAPERVVAGSGTARIAPTGRRPRPSGDGVTVLPGNLRSGGSSDDGRAVRASATPFQLPPLSLLDDHPPVIGGTDESVLHAMARRLTDTLSEFGVEGRVTAIRPGPVITMFEYEPAAGVKLSRIANLSDNLKMALKAISVRIVAPLPGRGCVGIEIPNEKRHTVWARDVFSAPEFTKGGHTLPMILGKDTEGRPFVTDLAKMPHLLVGGTTGSGKSVGVNSMLVSMLYMRTPEELRMILIDPKMREFALYEDIPHLLHPVVTEPKFASAVLKWACTEMDERYRIMARWQTRHIDTYNQKVEKELQDWTPEKARSYAPKDWPAGELLPVPKKFPFIVIVIDELADLMMVASSDVEASISRIVAKARAAGIHLIVATQTPRRDVITGLIKANMPASLAYQVRSGLDSRVILDQNGAESLLGKGDLLFLRPGTSDLVRIHAPFLSEDEVHRVGDFLREQGAPNYELRISASEATEDGDEPATEFDEKYDEAVELAIQKGKISTSMLQRHLGIGYNRAANIVETMEREGVVGPADGARPREVLVGQT
jgi:ribosomal protein S25